MRRSTVQVLAVMLLANFGIVLPGHCRADENRPVAADADKGKAADLVKVLEDPAARDKLIGQMKLMSAAAEPPPESAHLLPLLPESMADVGQDWSLGSSAFATLWHSVQQFRQHMADPRWRDQATLRAIRSLAWTLVIGVVAWGGRKVLYRVGRRVLPTDRTYRLLPKLLDAILLLLAGMFILSAWGADSLAWALSVLGQRLIQVALAVMLGLFAWEWLNVAIDRYVTRKDGNGHPIARSGRVLTLLPLIRNAVKVTLIIILALVALSAVGINIGPLLAGASVIGVAIGFGSQKLVQDVITGMFILFEDTIAVGDVVKIGDHAGQVEGMTIRTVRLRDVTGQLHIIPFGSIAQITNQSRDFGYHVFELTVPADADLDHVTALLEAVGAALGSELADEVRDGIDLFGVSKLSAAGASFSGRIKTVPGRQLVVADAFNRQVAARLRTAGIAFALPAQSIYLHPPVATAPVPASEGATSDAG